jgi:hypothetical protein
MALRLIHSTVVTIVLMSCIEQIDTSKDIIIDHPFYLRARIHDSHTASVQFEIARENRQRRCQQYKFTIRRNRGHSYSMPEQNLTFWRNSLELKELEVGQYNVCAIICSEYIRQYSIDQQESENRLTPIMNCVAFDAPRSHFLILTLYVLVAIFLIISHVIYSLRKRKFQARIKLAMLEIESSVQKWRSTQTSILSSDNTPTYITLHSIVNLPVSPVEHATGSSISSVHTDRNEATTSPIIFHLNTWNEESTASET